jgi:peptide/nickel transport system substrate-binding protein
VTIDFMLGNSPEERAVGEVLQSMTAEAGFDLKLRVVEAATAFKSAEDGDFQLYENNWSGRTDPDGNSMIYQTCGAPQNLGHYCDKEIDAWHREARAASDVATRKAAYEKITARFLAEGWMIYLYHPQYLIAHTARLENFKPMPDGLIRVMDVKLK